MKKLVIIVFILSATFSTQAQINLQLSLLSDNKTYLVSMMPEKTWLYPNNITGTAQVTLKYASSKRFMVANLKSLLTNVQWHDNSYLDSAKSSGGYSFISFALRSQGTTAIPYEAGKEVPLFTFTNYYDCAEKVELINNNESHLSGVEDRTYNIGNHWTTVGNQKEAYQGNLQSVVNCSTATSITNKDEKLFSSLIAYPVPASDHLTLRINAKSIGVQKINQISFLNALGKIVLTQKIKVQPGDQELTIDVSTLRSGLYLFQFQGDQVASESYKFIIIED